MSTNTAVEEKVIVDTTDKNKIEPPKLHRVIYVNDNVTTMEFVIETLIEIFNHSEASAIETTYEIHEKGSSTVAVLPYEIAEHKGVEVTVLARSNNFPLQIKIEPDG